MRRLLGGRLVVFTLATCRTRPLVKVRPEPGAMVFDLQTWGEYPADVARIRLSDRQTGEVVWSATGVDGAQLGVVRLVQGENPIQPSDIRHGSFRVEVPANVASFRVASNHQYLLEIWGSQSKGSRSDIVFVLK